MRHDPRDEEQVAPDPERALEAQPEVGNVVAPGGEDRAIEAVEILRALGSRLDQCNGQQQKQRCESVIENPIFMITVCLGANQTKHEEPAKQGPQGNEPHDDNDWRTTLLQH